MATKGEFMRKPWDERRGALLADLAALVLQLDRGQLPHVSTDIAYTYAHFYRGKRELGDLALADALHALVEDVFDWYDAGKENRRGERGGLDLREADRVELQTH